MEKLAASLADAQVDLNPHQVEAALFAFRSPLSKGAILADEVGLGKTIEAGILLSQRWAERKRKILVIVPASLRKQWQQELSEKFFLPSVILETKTFNEQIRAGNLNPFNRSEIVICSYQFARSKEPYVRQVAWNLAVIDEAHRLRNVYKPSNKIGNAIKGALAPFDKLLLTATPLQNSLLELFGLVSIIDEHTTRVESVKVILVWPGVHPCPLSDCFATGLKSAPRGHGRGMIHQFIKTYLCAPEIECQRIIAKKS
jgi:SNF2 family DNA or RNA helicase